MILFEFVCLKSNAQKKIMGNIHIITIKIDNDNKVHLRNNQLE